MTAQATVTVRLARPERAEPAPMIGRVPRVARLMAFAHHLDAQIRAGVFDDQAGAARKLGLTRARVTQIANLLLLAPAIQAEILAMPPVVAGRDPLSERTLRPIVAEPVGGGSKNCGTVCAHGMRHERHARRVLTGAPPQTAPPRRLAPGA